MVRQLEATAIAFQRPRAVSEEARRIAEATADDPTPPDVDAPQWLHLAGLSREAVSPLARLEQALHPWTSFVIVPLFVLANAGVRIGGDGLGDARSLRVAAGVGAGLVVGKVAGIALGAIGATRLGLARLPEGVRWTHVIGVAALGGIGFTVSLFVASLAFEDLTLLNASKFGILSGSVVAGLAGGLTLARGARNRSADESRQHAIASR